ALERDRSGKRRPARLAVPLVVPDVNALEYLALAPDDLADALTLGVVGEIRRSAAPEIGGGKPAVVVPRQRGQMRHRDEVAGGVVQMEPGARSLRGVGGNAYAIEPIRPGNVRLR